MNVPSHVLILLPCVLLFLAQDGCSAVNPGLKFRITQQGLNYAATQAIHSLKLVGIKIDDIHGQDNVKVGKVKYDITNMVVRSFVAPASAMTLNAGGLHWSATGCNAGLSGRWHYEYKLGFIKIKDSGSFELSIRSASVGIQIAFGMDASHRATISSGACTADVQRVDVHLHGGASWFYKLFDHQIEHVFKDQLKKVLCVQAKKAVDIDANTALKRAKYVFPIRHTGVLDYSMLIPPIMGSGYIDTHHKGEVFWFNDRTEAPFSAAPFPESFTAQRMLTIWLSDYLLDTAGWQLYRKGTLQYDLSASDLQAKDRDLLNTTCLGQQCIGNFIPALQDEVPHSSIIINMSVSQPPRLQVSPKGLQGDFHGQFRFSAYMPNHTVKYLFTMKLVAKVSLTVAFNAGKVTGKVTDIASDVKILNSTIGGISAAGLNWTMHTLNKAFIIPKFNSVGKEGIALPGTDQISFANTSLHLVPNALVIATDVKWTPKDLLKLATREDDDLKLRYRAGKQMHSNNILKGVRWRL